MLNPIQQQVPEPMPAITAPSSPSNSRSSSSDRTVVSIDLTEPDRDFDVGALVVALSRDPSLAGAIKRTLTDFETQQRRLHRFDLLALAWCSIVV
jgi:hypothetical protein